MFIKIRKKVCANLVFAFSAVMQLSLIAHAAPLTYGFVQPMPNDFWTYNTTTRQTGTVLQQTSPLDNPDVFCAQEGYRLPGIGEFSSQWRSNTPPWAGSGDASMKLHWSAFPDNDITKPPLPSVPAGTRMVGGGLFNEWGNLSSYAAPSYNNGKYVLGWNQTWYWVTEPTVQGGRYGRYVVGNTETASWATGVDKYGVFCIYDLVSTPANS